MYYLMSDGDVCPGYEELTAGPAGVEYSKGYNSSSQAQAKSAATGPGKGKNNNSAFTFLTWVFKVTWNFKV